MGACYSCKSGRIHIHRTTYDMDKTGQKHSDDNLEKRKLPVPRHKRLSPYSKDEDRPGERNSKLAHANCHLRTSDSFYKLSDQMMPSKPHAFNVKKSQLPIFSGKPNLNSTILDTTSKCNFINDSLNQNIPVSTVDSNFNGTIEECSTNETYNNVEKESVKLITQSKSLPRPQIPQLKLSSQVFPQDSICQNSPRNCNYFSKKTSSFPINLVENDGKQHTKCKKEYSQVIHRKVNNSKVDAVISSDRYSNNKEEGKDQKILMENASEKSVCELNAKEDNGVIKFSDKLNVSQDSKKRCNQIHQNKTVTKVMLNKPMKTFVKDCSVGNAPPPRSLSDRSNHLKPKDVSSKLGKELPHKQVDIDVKNTKAESNDKTGKLAKNIPTTQDIKKTLQSIENRIERTKIPGKSRFSGITRYGFKGKKSSVFCDNSVGEQNRGKYGDDSSVKDPSSTIGAESYLCDLVPIPDAVDQTGRPKSSLPVDKDGYSSKQEVINSTELEKLFDMCNDLTFIDEDDSSLNDKPLIEEKIAFSKDVVTDVVESCKLNPSASLSCAEYKKSFDKSPASDAKNMISKSQNTQTDVVTTDKSDQTELFVKHKENQTCVEVTEKSTFMSPVKHSKEETYTFERPKDLSPNFVTDGDDPDFLIDDEICDQPELLIKSLTSTEKLSMEGCENSTKINEGRDKCQDGLSSLSTSIGSIISESLMVEFEEKSISHDRYGEPGKYNEVEKASPRNYASDEHDDTTLVSENSEFAHSNSCSGTPPRTGRHPQALFSRGVYHEWTNLVNSVDSSSSMVHSPNERYIRNRVNQIPDNASPSPEGRSRVLFRPPRKMSIEPDEKGLKIDSPSYRCILQDITSMKTLLFKLKRVLDESQTISPFDNNMLGMLMLDQNTFDENELEKEQLNNGKIDYKQHFVDMRRIIDLQREQLKEKDHIIKMLQAQLLQTSQAKPYLSGHFDRVNTTTQTEKPRLLCDTLNEEPSGPFVSFEDEPVK